MSTTGVRQPGCRGFSALGPWLCVLAFQRVCPFAPQFLILNEFAFSIRITNAIHCKKYAVLVIGCKVVADYLGSLIYLVKCHVVSAEKTVCY